MCETPTHSVSFVVAHFARRTRKTESSIISRIRPVFIRAPALPSALFLTRRDSADDKAGARMKAEIQQQF